MHAQIQKWNYLELCRQLTPTLPYAIYLLNNVLIWYKLQAYTVIFSICRLRQQQSQSATICWKHLTSYQRKWKKNIFLHKKPSNKIITIMRLQLANAEIDETDWFLCLPIIVILILYCDFVQYVHLLGCFIAFCWHIANSTAWLKSWITLHCSCSVL